MRKIILTIFLSSLLFLSASPALAAVCQGEYCGGSYAHCEHKTSGEGNVGPFLCDITSKCYNSGECSLADIMTVINNVGLFVLGIIGSLVLLMYVYGGFIFLTARGASEQVTKGKSVLIKATIGMIIVFAAFAGMNTVESVLRTGELASEGSSCTNQADGTACGTNMRCQGGICKSQCDISKANAPEKWGCVDKNSSPNPDQCITELCPGGNNIQCCPIK